MKPSEAPTCQHHVTVTGGQMLKCDRPRPCPEHDPAPAVVPETEVNPIFLPLGIVESLHTRLIDAFGGPAARQGALLRDRTALLSALGQAPATFDGAYLHQFPWGMAAAYAFHLAQNQPFLDGNKRIGLAAALVFLDRNGFAIEQEAHHPQLADAMIAVAERRLDKESLAKVLEEAYTKWGK